MCQVWFCIGMLGSAHSKRRACLCLRATHLPLPGLLVLEGEVLPPVVLVNNSTFQGSRRSSQEKQCRFENSDLFSPENVLPNLVKITCWGDLRGWFPSYNESIFKQSKFCRYSIDDTAFSVKMRGCFSICQTFSFLGISYVDLCDILLLSNRHLSHSFIFKWQKNVT